VRADVLSALANLGYQRASVEKAVDRVLAAAIEKTFEPILREVLKALAR
jgi:Holliday junction resolvasome RuvABC DNA-binding subunit